MDRISSFPLCYTLIKEYAMTEVRMDELLKRISVNPKVMGGKPVILGTRLTVEFILGELALGETTEEILAEYPSLVKEDIQACLFFASRSLQNVDFMPLSVER
jgi:uncharacterized protein (DUF433 family)